MQKSRLILLLKKFSREEIKEFEKFIASPYFSRGRNLKPAFLEIRKYYPEFTSSLFTEETLFHTLNPGKKFNKKTSLHTIHVIFSELTAMAEKFMVYNSFEKGKYQFNYNVFLAESYRDRGILEPVLKILKKNSEIIDKDEYKFDYYLKRLETNMAVSGVYYTGNKPKNGYEFSRNNLLYIYALLFDLMNKFVNEYFVNRYSYNLEYKGFEVVKLFIDSFDPEIFRKYCVDDEFSTARLVLFNYYIIKSRLDEDDKDSLENAFLIFTDTFNKLTRFVQWFNFVLLFNRFYGRIRFDKYYLLKANELVDFVWSKGVLSTYEKINLHLGSYHSALLVKAAVCKSSELKDFIDNYSIKLDPDIRKESKEYSYAILYFKDNRFDEALRILSTKDRLNFPSMKINRHKLKICCLYELSFSEEALLAIDSFDHYLRNNRNVSEILKNENLKFTSCVKKMIKMMFSDPADRNIEFSKILELTQNSIYGYWFLKKINN